MPRTPRFKTGSIDDLFRQLRYAPTDTRERLLVQAERLVEEIEPGRAYPEEFVVYRITGYRPAGLEPGVMLVGDALLADLAVFVRRLSESLRLDASCERRGAAEPVDELARRLGVSNRTVRRWHQRGLLLHSVTDGRGVRRLACYRSSLDAFRRRIGDTELARASRFSRVQDSDERAIIAQAVELARTERLSRQAIAKRLAPRHGRAVETIRLLLARHEEAVGHRVFPGIEHTDGQERRIIHRAASRGLLASEIAHRLGRSSLTIRRVINRHRLDRLRHQSVTYVSLPTFSLEGAADVILAPAWVRFGLAPPGEVDAVALLTACRDADSPASPVLEARVASLNYLKHRCVTMLREADREPSDELLDRAETDLRWAAMLKRSIVRDLLPTAVARANAAIARPLLQQSAETIRSMILLLVSEISQTVETFDPGGRQRLERVVAYNTERALARRVGGHQPGRAGARHAPGSIPLDDPLARLSPWQPVVEAPLRLLRRVDRLTGVVRDVFVARHGLSGEAPLTVAEISERFGWSHRRTDRLLRESMAIVLRSS